MILIPFAGTQMSASLFLPPEAFVTQWAWKWQSITVNPAMCSYISDVQVTVITVIALYFIFTMSIQVCI